MKKEKGYTREDLLKVKRCPTASRCACRLTFSRLRGRVVDVERQTQKGKSGNEDSHFYNSVFK